MRLNRDEYLDHLCFERSDREIVAELFGLLLGTEEKWREQGATDDEINLTAFAWDWVETAHAPIDTGPLSGLEEHVVREDDEVRVMQDRFGRTMVLPKTSATIALPQDYPVADEDDWEKLRYWFRFEPSRVDHEALLACKESRKNGAMVRFHVWGAYDFLRQLMGDEEACLAVLEEPELVEDMLQTVGDMQEQCIREVLKVTPIDYLSVHEDFAGNNGPLIGPNIINKLFNPYYQRMGDLGRAGGARIFDLDSDGFIDPIVEALLDGGINCLHPIEPAAGSDMVRLRKRYGKNLILRGGLNKYALTKGQTAIDEELDYRLDPVLRGGGTLFSLDHRIPREVSIEAYRYYVQSLRKRLGLPPAEVDEPGWRRMA